MLDLLILFQGQFLRLGGQEGGSHWEWFFWPTDRSSYATKGVETGDLHPKSDVDLRQLLCGQDYRWQELQVHRRADEEIQGRP